MNEVENYVYCQGYAPIYSEACQGYMDSCNIKNIKINVYESFVGCTEAIKKEGVQNG